MAIGEQLAAALNAAVERFGRLAWDRRVAVNLRGAFVGMKHESS